MTTMIGDGVSLKLELEPSTYIKIDIVHNHEKLMRKLIQSMVGALRELP